MLKIVIQWNYYKQEKSIRDFWKWRWKKNMVYFYDYDDIIGYIIKNMDYSDLQKLRLNIYNSYHKLVKFTPFSEMDKNWNKFEWYRLQSPIIEISYDDFALLIPNRDYRKRFFLWDNIREKYYLSTKFINYIKLNVV